MLGFALPAVAAGPTLLFDPATQEVISQDRAGDPWYPASITKLMTAYIIFQKLKSGEMKLDQKLPVSELAHSQPPSKIGVPVGKTVSVDFALQALLVYSANDMAYVLAEAAAGSIPVFAAEMNAEARKLGMTGSHFENPNGLFDPRHVTTARDIAILASTILREFPEYDHFFSQPYLAIGKRRLMNRNSLLRQMKEADGMKTGFVCNSGFNLVATATEDGHRLAAVILGANSGKHRVDLAEMLLTDGFSRPAAPRVQLQSIPNVRTGGIVPADMTRKLCKQKPITLAMSKSLGGWGISFGNYENSATADMALRGRMLSPSGMDLMGTPGVIRLPENRGFAAAVWNLDKPESEAACARYHAEKAPCEVIPPETFAKIAALAPDLARPPVTVDPEGDDVAKPAPKTPPAKKKKKN
ncbi:D-alanyl-D-alanine carboxypeptidase family protein [Aestuariivirga sp.]|uniref:D-alanyl-D-alanine carboxypeptidase family protein n=1 Tax=Aestuariivirga sp. TaxID=2650926 RepID=UPI0025BDECC4|nr:D-alanyl-D-alanine carboxypeptidase family protein [Aestuariivirga sp.]MCA3554295.1 D-alanyl-D-alanine carboxypeptidase [Aestuariivirga sp.]